MSIKTKKHDFSISRKLYIKSSYSHEFVPEETSMLTANRGKFSEDDVLKAGYF